MDLTFQYTKVLRTFGRQPLFSMQGPDMCDSIPVNRGEFKNYIMRNPVSHAVQHGPIFSHHDVNTYRARYSTTGINHAEGGWPKDVNVLDPEATQRYRRREEKDDDYIHCVQSLAPGMEHYIMQNNAIDMYLAYYANMVPAPPLEKYGMRTVNEFRDQHKRPVSAISWQPEGRLFAASYMDVDFYRNPRGPIEAYLWDLDSANSPAVTFTPESSLVDLQFNPHGSNSLLAGGLVSGQVAQFDQRTGGGAVDICPPHVAHRDMVRNIYFIHSKSNMEIFSGGPDGCLKWWDLRNLSKPTDEMIIDVPKSSFDYMKMETAFGVSTIEYEPTIPTRFMVGTENGLIIGGNRKGKTPMEQLPLKYQAHLGPIWSLQRNPNFPKNFLSVGDWTARIWAEECRESSIIWTAPQRYKVTAGQWSPTRLSLMMLCSQSGRAEVWDLLRNQSGPVITMQVSSSPLTMLQFHDKGQLVAVGCQNGPVMLLELAFDLTCSSKMDKSLLASIFDRESKRERILEARLREIKLKLKQAEEMSPETSATDVDPTVGDRDLAEATTDYFAQVKKELAGF